MQLSSLQSRVMILKVMLLKSSALGERLPKQLKHSSRCHCRGWSDRTAEGEGLGVKPFEGLTTNFEAGKFWTIMRCIWNHLNSKWEGSRVELAEQIYEKRSIMRQEKLEERGYRSPTWSLPRALQDVNGARRLYGESAIPVLTAAPIFEKKTRRNV